MSKKPLFVFLFCISIFTFSQEIQKDSLSITPLEEVTVKSLRVTNKQPFTYINIDKQKLEKRNLGQDIPVLLNFLPNVVTTSDAGAGIGYTGIRIRGSGARSINVSINGIPYNDSESQGVYWVNLPDLASSMSSMQIQRGVGSSTNGVGGFGGSINITTEKYAENAFASFSNSFGSFNTLKNTMRFSTGLLNDGFEFSGRVSSIVSDGYLDRSASDLKSYFFQFYYKNENRHIKLLTFSGKEVTQQAWYGISPEQLKNNRQYNPAGEIYNDSGTLTGFYDDQKDNYEQAHYQFHWNEKFSTNWDFSLGLNYTKGMGYYEEYKDLWFSQNIAGDNAVNYSYLGLNPIQNVNDTITATENIQRKWLDNDFYVANASLSYVSENLDMDVRTMYSHYIGDHFGELIWAKNPSDATPYHRFYENKGIKKELNSVMRATHKFNQMTGFIDLQLRQIDYNVSGTFLGPTALNFSKEFMFFNPKAGVTYTPNQKNRYYLSYAIAQREPNRTDFENNIDVKSEYLQNIELGWKYFGENIKSEINLYYMDYKNQLVLTGNRDDVGNPIRNNVGDSYRQGIELNVAFKIIENLFANTNLSLSENKNKNFYFERDGKLENLGETNISFSPNIVGANSFTYYALNNDLEISLLSKYVDEQYLGNIDSDLSKLDAYHLHDISISYDFEIDKIKEVKLNVLFNNILNTKYVSNGYFYTYDDTWSTPNQVATIEGVGYYPQAGFNFLVGVDLTF